MTSFNELPFAIHWTLSKYLAAVDLVSLEQVSKRSRATYRPLSWSKVYVCDDEKIPANEAKTVYINDPTYRVIPFSVFEKPWLHKSTFPTKLIKTLCLNTIGYQKCYCPSGDGLQDIQHPIEWYENLGICFFPNVSKLVVAETHNDFQLPATKPANGNKFFVLALPAINSLAVHTSFELINFTSPKMHEILTHLKMKLEDLNHDSLLPFLPSLNSLILTPKFVNYEDYVATIIALNTQTPKLRTLVLDFFQFRDKAYMGLDALTHLPHDLDTCHVIFNHKEPLGDGLIDTYAMNTLSFPQITSCRVYIFSESPAEPSSRDYFMYAKCPNLKEFNSIVPRNHFVIGGFFDPRILTKLSVKFCDFNGFFSFLNTHEQLVNLESIWIHMGFFDFPGHASGRWKSEDFFLVDDMQVKMLPVFSLISSHWELFENGSLDVSNLPQVPTNNDLVAILRKLHSDLEASSPSDTELVVRSPEMVMVWSILFSSSHPILKHKSCSSLPGFIVSDSPLDVLFELYRVTSLLYSALMEMTSLKTAVLNSVFAIDFIPSFHRLIHSHKTLKALFISEYNKTVRPYYFYIESLIKRERSCPKISSNDYMQYTSEVLVGENLHFHKPWYHRTSYSGGSYSRVHPYEELDFIESMYQNPMPRWHRQWASGEQLEEPEIEIYPQILNRIDVEGLRNSCPQVYQSGFEYYYNREKTNLQYIKKRYMQAGHLTMTIGSNDQDMFTQFDRRERIQRYPYLTSSYLESYLQRNHIAKYGVNKYTSDLRRFEMLPLVNYETLDIHG